MTTFTDFQKKIGVNPDGVLGPATLNAAAKYFKLSKSSTAHFFGETSNETGGFVVFSENLNYSADGLVKTFPKYFTAAQAAQYAHKPDMIANRVYANRMGNGNEASGDGYKYRGRGALQLTGRNAYAAFGKSIGVDLVANPDLVTDTYAFESAKWFFDTNNVWRFTNTVDDASITAVRKLVNGGSIGLQNTILLTKKYYSWIA